MVTYGICLWLLHFKQTIFDFENKDNEILKNLSSLFLFQFSNAVMAQSEM